MTDPIEKPKKEEVPIVKPVEDNEGRSFKSIIPLDLLKNNINLKEEVKTDLNCFVDLKRIANKENAVLLAFIAPYVGERISPIEEKSAIIDISEELGVSAVIAKIQKEKGGAKKLFLLIDSPGGRVDSSYNIALALRKNFEDITVFIPRLAASGGTLIAMTGNKIVMNDMAHLSPIDVQVPYKGERVSANTIEKAITRLEKYFEKKLPAEAPYPHRAMTEKLDPILREDWGAYTEDIWVYTSEILNLVGYEKNDRIKIALSFILPPWSHSFMITKKRAKNYGLKISDSPDELEILEVMSKWLSVYFPKQGTKHFLRYILPD